MSAADTYFITWKGRRDGPYTLDQLADLLARGEIGLLHRVETADGLVPLRDLLPAPTLADITPVSSPLVNPVKAEYGLLGPPPTPVPVQAPLAVSAAAPLPMPETPPTGRSATEPIDPEKAARLYTICGLCFVFPPLAGWSWMLSDQLAKAGQPLTAARTKWLSIGLAGGGIVLWILLWHFW